jgi:hypothetical protein
MSTGPNPKVVNFCALDLFLVQITLRIRLFDVKREAPRLWAAADALA